MKKLCTAIIFILLLATAQLSYGQWTQLAGPQGGNPNALARVGTAIYAGTGNGIYISTDEGASWQLSPLIDSNICNGIYSNGDTAVIFYSNYGVYYNVSVFSITTFDGGNSWSSPVNLGLTNDQTIPYAIDYTRIGNTLTVYIAGYEPTYTSYYYSYDFGHSWANFTSSWTNNNSYTPAFYNDPSSAICLASNVYSGYSSLYYSIDGLHTWNYVDSMYYGGNFAMVDDSVWLAGLASSDTLYYNYMIRTTNHGATWDTVLNIPYPYAPDQLQIINGVYVLSTFSQTADTFGYFISNDKGRTWNGPSATTPVNNSYGVLLTNGNYLQTRGAGYNTSTIVTYVPAQDTFYATTTGISARYTISLHNNKNVLFAGCNDDLYRSTDAGQTWNPTGLGLNTVYDMAFMGDTIFAASRIQIARSFNNGVTWQIVATDGNAYQDWISVANWNGKIVYSGSHFRYSADYGNTWDTLPFATYGDLVGAIATSGGNLISVGMEGSVCMYNANTQVWDSITTNNSPGAHTFNCLYNVDSTLVLAGEEGMIISTDHGQTWSPCALNGVPQFFSQLSEVPHGIVSYNGLWVGEVGPGITTPFGYGYDTLWVSSDLGQDWQPMQLSSPVPFGTEYSIHDLTIMNNVLYSTSAASGVWRFNSSFATFTGTVYNDLNNNGVQDPGEPGIAQTLVNIQPANLVATTDTSGNYSIVSYAVGDTLRPVSPVAFGTVSPPYYLTTGNSSSNLNFGVYVPSNVADLAIDMTNAEPFSWTRNTFITITVTNKGSLPQAATVQLALNSGLFYLNASLQPQSNQHDTITWVTQTLNLLQQVTINVFVEPNGSIGDPVVCHAVVLPVVNDTVPSDNYAAIIDSITGPFDPNSKTCQQGSFISTQQIAEAQTMTYIVRFQNDGNAPAVNVHISDTLSTNFDMSTFKVLGSSNAMLFNLHNDGIVDFYFNNINLPPSSVSADSSSGFVKYSINCKTSLSTGNALVNTASIYFDNNPAVVTNTTVTLVGFNEVIYPTAVALVSFNDTKLKVYPNPTQNQLHIDFGDITGLSAINIYDAAGRLIKTQEIRSTIETLYLDEVESGMYLGQVIGNGNQLAVFRFVVSK